MKNGLVRKLPQPAVLLTAILLLACSGGDDEDGAATATRAPVTNTPVPEATRASATATPPPLPTTPREVAQRVPKTVWLIDVASANVQTLAEEYDSFAVSARFFQDRAQLAINEWITEFDLEGKEIGPAPTEQRCKLIEQGEQIDGRWHPSIECDDSSLMPQFFFSPDGRWFVYRLPVPDPSPTPVFPPVSEMWALNLETGERHLLHEMQDCGGCDGRYGPAWSPSGRYYVFAETGGEARVFLSDLDAKVTRQIANGNEVSDRPQWAPGDDLLLYRSPDGFTVVENAGGGVVQTLDHLPWPAQFDASGDVIYSPAFVSLPKEGQAPSLTTTFVSVTTFEVLGTLEGAPEWLNLWRPMTPVSVDPVLIAALVGAPGCEGIQVYREGSALTCVDGGTGATISPDGKKVAIARTTGQTGHVTYPGGGAVSLNHFEIVIVDLTTGSTEVLATDAVSDQSPVIVWNGASSHLLVEWPVFGGL